MPIIYTKKEEIWNTWSHAGGAIMAGAVGIAFIIVVCLGNMDRMWAGIGVGLYLLGMTGSYLASTIYHALKLRNPWRERMRKWDHAAIYWHIAGSYSPITLMAMRDHGMWGWMLFTFVWSCAIIGTVISFIKLKDHSNIETACFCIMGLSVLVAFKPLLDTVSTNAFVWIVLEGIFYITGAVFYSFNKTKYMHTVFHFCVLAGSICHIVAVWDILIRDIF